MPSASGSVLLNGTSTNVGTTLTVTATQTSQNVTANTSVITLTYTIASGRSWGAFYTPSNTYMTPTIDGVEGTRTKVTNPADLNAGQSAVVLTTTHTVKHNSDGTKTVGISVFYDDRPGGGATTKTVSTFYMTLDTIPRASTLSVTSSQTMGTSYRFTISRASSDFRHKITYAFGNTSGTVLDTTTSDVTTKDWTPPTSLASQSVVTGGSKSATITYYLYTYSGGTNIGTVSATATLSIPSADSLNAVTASQTMGTAYTFTCGQNAPNYTHKLNWSFGSASGTDNTAFTTSKSFTPATSLGSQIPSSNSGTIYYTITTYNGSTIVGTSSAKSATLSIPSGAEPAFSFSASVTNGNSLGVPIVGYSTVAWSTTGVSTKYGATVASYSFSFAGVSSTDATKSGVKLISGSAGGTSYTPTMTVTDSRGKKTTHTASAVTVYTYSAPVIVSSYAYRSDANGNRKDDGTYIAYFSNVKTDYTCGGHNTVVAEHRYRPTNGSWDSWYGHYINQQILSADWSITQSYQFEIRVRDSLGSTKSVAYTIPTASVAFNIKEGGKGWAFGGYAQEDGILQVYGGVRTNNDGVTIGDNRKIHIWEDSEGGNITISSPDGHNFNFDAFDNNSLRIFSLDNSGNIKGLSFNRISGSLHTNGFLTEDNGLNIGNNKKVHIWEDNEGGNISIYSPNGQGFHLDAFDNDTMRLYRFNNAGTINATSFDRNGNVMTDGNFYAHGHQCLTDENYVLSNTFYNIANDGSKGHFTGYGTLSFSWVNPNLVMITYMYQITKSDDSSAEYNFGLNRNLINVVTGVSITPITGGWWRVIPNGGSEPVSLYGYGTTHASNAQYWTPGRMYTVNGDVGLWSSRTFTAGQYIYGVCYGKV